MLPGLCMSDIFNSPITCVVEFKAVCIPFILIHNNLVG